MIDWVVLSPLFVGIVCAVALWLGWRRWPRWLRALGFATLATCYLLMTPLVANTLLGLWEARAEATCNVHPRAVVVLSGGGKENAAPDDFASLGMASVRRTVAGVSLWRKQAAGTMLVLSGGSGIHGQVESSRMAALAQVLGVPARFIRTEGHSSNTWENAHALAALQPALPRKVWLVTSAVHMARARYAMHQAGFEVCSAPTDYRTSPLHWVSALLPTTSALAKTQAVLHEAAGMAWYRIKSM